MDAKKTQKTQSFQEMKKICCASLVLLMGGRILHMFMAIAMHMHGPKTFCVKVAVHKVGRFTCLVSD